MDKGVETMAKRHKRRLFTGAVCTQIVYTVSDGADKKTSKPRKPRFQTREEQDEFNRNISEAKLEALVNANFGPTSLYSTLTLDDENEVHTAAEMKLIRDRFYRRLLYKYPNAKIVIVYGQGKSTSRFHLHMISDGIPEEEIGRIWGLGSVVEIRRLREHNYYADADGNKIDHGRDYKALADYLHAAQVQGQPKLHPPRAGASDRGRARVQSQAAARRPARLYPRRGADDKVRVSIL